jgi:hypothetical protein
MIADGEPLDWVGNFCCKHIVLTHSLNDCGDTPRAIGSLKAIEQGYDAIAYLDSDNWYEPNHISSLLDLQAKTSAAVCTSKRRIHHLDGRPMAICLGSDGEQFCDTSCLMLLRPAFDLTSVWASILPGEHGIDDRIMWHAVKRGGYRRTHSDLPTVCYRATHAGFYVYTGWPVPNEAVRNNKAVEEAHARWKARGNPALDYTASYELCAKAASKSLPTDPLPWLPGLYPSGAIR